MEANEQYFCGVVFFAVQVICHFFSLWSESADSVC